MHSTVDTFEEWIADITGRNDKHTKSFSPFKVKCECVRFPRKSRRKSKCNISLKGRVTDFAKGYYCLTNM